MNLPQQYRKLNYNGHTKTFDHRFSLMTNFTDIRNNNIACIAKNFNKETINMAGFH